MSKINLIQNKLKEIEGGLFQKICDAYLSKKEEGNITSLGSQDGTNKTIKGTPDSYILTPTGKFIFIEYTTQKKKISQKIKDDLTKCFDESKTGIPIEKIHKIIYCHIKKLKPKEIDEIHEFCKNHGCLYTSLDISTLSFDLAYNYPEISNDLLDIPIDSGQFLSIKKFIEQKSSLVTLENEFLFREDEFKILNEYLAQNNIVLISGKSGTGKTRIALEIMKHFLKKNPNYSSFCIENKGINIFQDINLIIQKDSNAILLIDDANRWAQLKFLLTHLSTNSNNIKIILTARDYGLSQIMPVLSEFEYSKYTISNFSKDQIKDILKHKSIGIKNYIALDRIADVSKGNPRLAIMAARIALKENNLSVLNNSYNIYNSFFSNIVEVLNKYNDKDLKIVLGIISYFHLIDGTGNLDSVYKYFKISDATFWDKVDILYSLELVDLFQEKICKISDQIYATFFFYKLIIEEKILDYKIFLNHFFLKNIQRMKEAIYQSANIFDQRNISKFIQPIIKKVWEEKKAIDSFDTLYHYADTFYFAISNEILVYIHEIINDTAENNSEIVFKNNSKDNKIFNLLSNFSNFDYDEMKISIELACDYIIKRNDLANEFIQYTKKGFTFNKYRPFHDIDNLKTLFLIMEKKSIDNPKIILDPFVNTKNQEILV